MTQKILLVFVILFIISHIVAFASRMGNPFVTEVELAVDDITYRNVYLYNERGAKTAEVNYIWMSGGWQRRVLTEWLYNTNNQCYEQRVWKWQNSAWSPSHLIRFEYDNDFLAEIHYDTQASIETPLTKSERRYNNGLLLNVKEFAWQNDNWNIYSQFEYKYNTKQQPEELSIQIREPEADMLEKKLHYAYDALQRLTSIVTYQKTGADWEESSMVALYYKPNTTLKSYEILKKWDKAHSKWENKQNIEYTYDGQNRLIDERYQYWHAMFWVNDLHYKYEYNENNVRTKQAIYLPIYGDYRPAWTISYSEFMYGKPSLIEARNEFWGGDPNALYSTFIPFLFNDQMNVEWGSKIRIGYMPVDTVTPVPANPSSDKGYLHIYPNPSNSIFYFDIGTYNVSKWIVTDLSGKTILENNDNQHSGVIDLGDMKQGVYLFHAFTDEGVKMQKLIKE